MNRRSLWVVALLFYGASRQGWGDERILLSAFRLNDHVITPVPLLMGFSSRPADTRAFLIGVGWYEHALLGETGVEFVAEERGEIFERRASTYATSRICDLYEAVFADVGRPVAMPEDVKRYGDDAMTTDLGRAIALQHQEFKPLLLRIAEASFHEIDLVEPGFIQIPRMKMTKITCGRIPAGIVFMRLSNADGFCDLVPLPRNPAIDAVFEHRDAP